MLGLLLPIWGATATSQADELNVQLWGCDGRPNQRWTLHPNGHLELAGRSLVLGNSTLPTEWLQTSSMAPLASKNLVVTAPATGAAVQAWDYNASTAQLVSRLHIPEPNGTGDWVPSANVMAFSTGQVCALPSMTQYLGGWEYKPMIPGASPGTYAEESLWGSNINMVWCIRPSHSDAVGWQFNTTDQSVRFVQRPPGRAGLSQPWLPSNMCLDAGSFDDCSSDRLKDHKFCDRSKTRAERVADLLSKLTTEEKVWNMLGDYLHAGVKGVPRLGIRPMEFLESQHGLRAYCLPPTANSTGCPTSFPNGNSQGASWNRTLFRSIAGVIADEGRAFYNHIVPCPFYQKCQKPGPANGLAEFSPDINLFRDPRWGRGQEGTGEDPYLAGEWAYQYVKGLQEGEDPSTRKLLAVCKHFVAYDLESWGPTRDGCKPGDSCWRERGNFDAIIPPDQISSYYLPAFRRCIRDASAGGVMCSFNAVNGVPSCANPLYLNKTLRSEFDFSGFVVTDFGALNWMLGRPNSTGGVTRCDNEPYCQNYTISLDDSIAQAMAAGVNIDDNGPTFMSELLPALQNGKASMQLVDDSARRVLMAGASLGLMDPPGVYDTIKETDTALARQLALEAAEQGMTLLKNDGTLPLSSQSSVCLAGPMVDDLVINSYSNGTTKLLSNYNGLNSIVWDNTPLAAAQRHFGTVHAAKWFGMNNDPHAEANIEKRNNEAAITACGNVDAVLLFLTDDSCGEGKDRLQVALSAGQQSLIAALMNMTAHATRRIPVVAVLLTSGPTAVPQLKQDADAILQAYLPGQAAGEALMRVLTGIVAPAGRLPFTIYPEDIVNRSMFLTDLRADGGITYLEYTGKYGEPLWKFGEGLSYSNISEMWADPEPGLERAALTLRTEHIAESASTIVRTFSVTVKNEGSIVTDHVVLCFLSSNHTRAFTNKKLVNFGRVASLKPGQSETLHLELLSEQIAIPSETGVMMILPGVYDVLAGDVRFPLTTSFEVGGDAITLSR